MFLFGQKKNRRILTIQSPNNRLTPLPRKTVRKPIEGGWLIQTEEAPVIDWSKAKVVTDISPTEEQIASMKFAVNTINANRVKSDVVNKFLPLTKKDLLVGKSYIDAVK